MLTVSLTPLHASLVALSSSAFDGLGEQHTFRLDRAQSHVRYEIECRLGRCTLEPEPEGELDGELEMRLQPSVFPFSSGQESGGSLACGPDLLGTIESPDEGRPPLLRLGLEGLVLEPQSEPFEIDAHGRFQGSYRYEIQAGTLSASLLGAPPIRVDLAGAASAQGRGRGQFWIDSSGIHVLREVSVPLRLHDSALGLELTIRIRGVVRGDMPFPVPLRASATSWSEKELLCLHVLRTGSEWICQFGYAERAPRRRFDTPLP
jgi:hypothetical protein